MRTNYLSVLVHTRNKGEADTVKHFKPFWTSNCLSVRSKAVLLLSNLLLFVFRAILSCLFVAAMWSPSGKGFVSYVFVTFPYGGLGQVRYLIVWIPDLCLLLYSEDFKEN